MRTIKFRGKCCHSDAWAYGNLVDYGEDELPEIQGFDVFGEGSDYWQEITVERDTIGQFTGLYDKNGKEIYEGDIVEFYHFKTYCINPDCDAHLLGYGTRLIKAVEVVESKDGVFGVEDDYFGIFSSLDCGLMDDPKCVLYIKNYLSTRTDKEPPLFVGQQKPHGRLNISSVGALLRKLGRKCGIEKVHPHRFRRTCATMALHRGMPIDQVRLMLGHESIETTTIYAEESMDVVKQSHNKYL